MSENQFFVDSGKLSEQALQKKHQIEQDPSARTNHMEYMEGMERIESDVRERVLEQMQSYDYTRYTATDVKRALASERCSIEDFKALLSPAAAPFLEEMAQKAKIETSKHFGNTVYLFTPLYIANYCENYCVYCGFNCYNDIVRKQLNEEEMGKSLSCAWCIELIYRVLQLFALYTFQRYQTKGAPHICIKLTINIK